MAIKISNSTIIDDSRNIVSAGIATVSALNISTTEVISSARQLKNIASLDATTTATIETAIANAPNAFTDLSVTGIASFTNGPILVGSATSTGTASQRLQVTGGAYVSGAMGIGTSSPSQSLHIAGGNITLDNTDGRLIGFNLSDTFTSSVTSAVYGLTRGAAGANTVGLSGFSGLGFYTNNTQRARIDSSGRVGIGITSPSYLLHVNTSSATDVELAVQNSAGLARYGTRTSGNAFAGSFTAGKAFELWSANAQAVTIDSSGRVGMGITNPSEKLHVSGVIIGDSHDNYFGSYSSGSAYVDVGSLNTSAGWIDARSTSLDNVSLNIRCKGTSEIAFHSGFGEKARITSTGLVGIGETNPLQKLHVQGNLLVAAGSSTGQHITQKAYELNSGTLSWEGSAGQLFSITNNLTTGSIYSVNDVSGIPSIDVDANGTIQLGPYGGNIGIGTTNPTSKLQVAGNV